MTLNFYLFSNSRSDIALIKLPSFAQFSDYVKPIQLSTIPTAIDLDVTVMGYGLVKPKVFAQNLQFTNFKTIDALECRLDAENSISKSNIVCTKGAESALCLGDGGNPLVSTDTGKLVGVAIETRGSCGVRPQGFTDITAYTDWIVGLMDGTIHKISGGK